jgi:rod shape-determining protein MreD
VRTAKPHVAPFVGPRWYVAAAWLAAALIAQSTILHAVAIRNVVPSVVLVVVVWYAIRVDAPRAALFGLVAGLCEDILSPQSGGAWTISTTLVAVLAGMLSRGFFADSLPLVCTIVAFATLVRSLLFWTVMGFEGYPPGLGAMHFREALLQAVMNVAVMLVAMLVVRRVEAGA